MAESPADTNSSDAVVRTYAPPFLAEPYRAMTNGAFSDADRVRHGLSFVENTARYLAALQAVEARAAGVECGSLTRLFEKLDKPSLGDWVQAADGLSRTLVSRSDLVAPEVSGVLRDRDGNLTEAGRSLAALVELRNRGAHDQGIHASDHLVAMAPHLRMVAAGLRVLRRYPLLWTRSVAEGPDRRRGARVVRLAAELPTEDVDESRFDVPAGVPFIVGERGDVLLLHGWIAIDEKSMTPHLVSRRHKDALQYDAKDLKGAFVDLYALTPDGCCRRGAMPLPLADRLMTPLARTPKIRGYRIERQLGEGASGVVWLAVANGTEERVAVKVLRRELASLPRQRDRLRDEHARMQRINHPGVARVWHYGEDDEFGAFVVMEHVNGVDLGSLGERVAPPVALELVREVLDALSAAHREGVIHRDVKPSNVLVDAHGHAKLIDFGTSWAADETARTSTLDMVGTRGFSAPEQLRGERVDARADVYAAGRLLAELLGDEVPSHVLAVIRRATADLPSDRYATAEEMKRALVDPRAFATCPVTVGDRLGGYVVRGIMGTARALWMLHAVETASGEPVGVVLAGGKDALSIRDVAGALDAKARQAIGYRGVSVTPEGLSFVVVRAGDGPARFCGRVGPAPLVSAGEAMVVGASGVAAVGVLGAGALGTAAAAAVLAAVVIKRRAELTRRKRR